MSLPRSSFANIVPINKSKLGTKVYSASQLTSMVKENANTTAPKRAQLGVSSFYLVHSGLINDYRIIQAGNGGANGELSIFDILNGNVLDGNGPDGGNLRIFNFDGASPEFILDGN